MMMHQIENTEGGQEKALVSIVLKAVCRRSWRGDRIYLFSAKGQFSFRNEVPWIKGQKITRTGDSQAPAFTESHR